MCGPPRGCGAVSMRRRFVAPPPPVCVCRGLGVVGGGKGCQPPRGQAGMGLRRGNERVRGGLAFKGGGAPRLGLGPEAALKVMAHSGPRAGGVTAGGCG